MSDLPILERVPDRLKRKGRVRELTVTGREMVTPAMARIFATGPDLGDFSFRPGQSLILVLPREDDAVAARHYTIRAFDPAERSLSIDVFLHGERTTPANRWALEARPGDAFAAVGPRGHVALKEEASEHVILVDETGLPAGLSIIENLPAGAKATALVEIGSEESRQTGVGSDAAEIRWLVRGAETEPGLEALTALEPWNRDVHVYLAGETDAVQRQRRFLLSKGMSKARIYAEGYWRPGRVGGHDHIED